MDLLRHTPVHIGGDEGSQMLYMYGYVTYIHILTWELGGPLSSRVAGKMNFQFSRIFQDFTPPPNIYMACNQKEGVCAASYSGSAPGGTPGPSTSM